MKKIIFTFLLVLSFALPVHAAQNCSVEIIGVGKKEAIEYITNDLINLGFSIATINDYQLTVKIDINDFAVQLLYGSDFNRVPELRMELCFSQYNNNMKITATTKVITNPNSAFERTQNFNSKDTQKLLDRYKAILESGSNNNGSIISAFGFKYSPIPDSNQLLVDEIISKSPAEGKLASGDKITKLNNVPIYDVRTFTSIVNSSKKITLVIEHVGIEQTIILEHFN